MGLEIRKQVCCFRSIPLILLVASFDPDARHPSWLIKASEDTAETIAELGGALLSWIGNWGDR